LLPLPFQVHPRPAHEQEEQEQEQQQEEGRKLHSFVSHAKERRNSHSLSSILEKAQQRKEGEQFIHAQDILMEQKQKKRPAAGGYRGPPLSMNLMKSARHKVVFCCPFESENSRPVAASCCSLRVLSSSEEAVQVIRV